HGIVPEIKILELLSPAFAHGFLQGGITVVGKKLEWVRFVILLAHEEKRRLWRQHEQRRRQHARTARDKRGQAFPSRTIANLVVVLNADHVGRRGYGCAAGAARASAPELEGLALINKSILKGARNLLRAAKILVVAFA